MTSETFLRAAKPFLVMQQNIAEITTELAQMEFSEEQQQVFSMFATQFAMASYHLGVLSLLEAQKK
jgi:hypothetical protein